MHNNYSQDLINPLPTLLQWLSIKIVYASIATVRFIYVFSYAIKAASASKLIILVRFGRNINMKIPKASILPFSSTNLIVILPLFKYQYLELWLLKGGQIISLLNI
jgi:hypothetical protein